MRTSSNVTKPRGVVNSAHLPHRSTRDVTDAVLKGLRKGRVLLRQLRKRTPHHDKAILYKEVVPVLLSLSDSALRVLLARARFANNRTALSYPEALFLLRTLGFSCYAFAVRGLLVLHRADAELCRRGLLRQEQLRNNHSVFPGTRLTLPDGSVHSITKIPLKPFFIVCKFFYTSGAGIIWTGDKGLYRLSPVALKLLIALLSENDLGCYGGVNPNLLARHDGRLVIGGPIAEWDANAVAAALSELESRGFVSGHPATVSRKTGHLIRPGYTASYIDEQNVDVFAVRME